MKLLVCNRFAIQEGSTLLAERVGSNPRYGYPYNGFRVLDSRAGACRPIAERVLWFGILVPTILVVFDGTMLCRVVRLQFRLQIDVSEFAS